MKWICSQIGAREHYAVARALQQAGRLQTLCTDFWAGSGLRAASRIIPFGGPRALAGRWHPELDEKDETLKTETLKEKGKQKAEIVSWNFSTILRQVRCSLVTRHSSLVTPYARFIRDGRWLSEKVRDCLARSGTDLRNTVVFSYDTTALELFRWAKERGAFCVLDQIDPGRVEAELVREEEKSWPGWTIRNSEFGIRNSEVMDAYFRRRGEEWKLADRIIVNSRWSLEALIKQGVPAEKLMVIPLCYESRNEKAENRNSNTPHPSPLPIAPRRGEGESFQRSTFNFQPSTEKPLRVLFLGQVILRKGIQYLVEAAKLLRNEPVHFDVVGPTGISENAMKSAPANMTFHGRVNRDEAASWYGRSDVFVLPTISDGFALTQIEAMAHGLPVIATPNCGEVVSDGVDGFLVPARDAAALTKAIHRFLAEPELLKSQRIAALKKSGQFTLDRLAGRLLTLEGEWIGQIEGRNQK